MGEMEVLKQPWLTADEIHDGKPRYIDIDLRNKENVIRTLKYDRKHVNDSQIVEIENTITEADVETTNPQNENVDDFEWKNYTKDLLQCNETEVLMDVLSDLNSHTLVLLGNDRLKEEEAQKHLKIYKEHVKRTENRITQNLERQLSNLKKNFRTTKTKPKKEDSKVEKIHPFFRTPTKIFKGPSDIPEKSPIANKYCAVEIDMDAIDNKENQQTTNKNSVGNIQAFQCPFCPAILRYKHNLAYKHIPKVRTKVSFF